MYPKIFLLLLAVCLSSPVLALGKTGHRVSGEIASLYLTPKTQAAIRQLIATQSLAEVSTYADEMRSDPSEFWKKTSKSFHYVTVPDGKTYSQTKRPKRGDAVIALQDFAKTLADTSAPKKDRVLALKFIVHIIGDLHQPLHVGNGLDRGGNKHEVEFFWNKSNLHTVWDSGLIDGQKLSFSEWTRWLVAAISEENLNDWRGTGPLVWIAESQALRTIIYPENPKINWQYQHQMLPHLKLRLQQSGVRIADYLNRLLDPTK